MTSYVKRHTRADGRVAEYTYRRKSGGRPIAKAANGVAAMIDAFQRSPKWTKLSPRTRQIYALYLRDLYKFGNMPAQEVKRSEIMIVRDAIAKGRGHGAALCFIRAASSVWNWALDMRWEGIESNPALNGGKDLVRGSLTEWTQEEADVAMARLPEPLRRVVVLALYTAARRVDLCAMTWTSYDGESLQYVARKTRRVSTDPIIIPCHPALKAELDVWRQGTLPSSPILTDRHGKAWRPENLSHDLPEALARIGLTGRLNVHGLRYLAAINLADAGCTAHEIASVTGHHTLAMVQKYTEKANRRRLAKNAIARLVDLRDGAPIDNVRTLRRR